MFRGPGKKYSWSFSKTLIDAFYARLFLGQAYTRVSSPFMFYVFPGDGVALWFFSHERIMASSQASPSRKMETVTQRPFQEIFGNSSNSLKNALTWSYSKIIRFKSRSKRICNPRANVLRIFPCRKKFYDGLGDTCFLWRENVLPPILVANAQNGLFGTFSLWNGDF